MTGTVRRIAAMLIRYLYLHQRSLARALEIFLWPVMELMVWGFVTLYIQSLNPSSPAHVLFFLINAMIFWDVLYRSQQGITISVMEEIWHQNLMNLLVSPLKIWEWITATFLYGLLKTTIITGLLTILAYLFYHYDALDSLGFSLIPLGANILLFGWALGIFTSSLLIRWGYAAEALIWGVPFLVQPLSAIFYPLSILPPWLQMISRCLPTTYVFEGMRDVLQSGRFPTSFLVKAILLNAIYFLLAGSFFHWMYNKALESGRLVRIGMD